MKRSTPRGLPDRPELAALLTRDADQAAVRLACRGFCEYDKGGSGEAGCGGLAAVRRLLTSGRIEKNLLFRLAGMPPGPARNVPDLTALLCETCSYRPDGCDFMASAPVPESTPCGGYRLILALYDRGLVAPEDF